MVFCFAQESRGGSFTLIEGTAAHEIALEICYNFSLYFKNNLFVFLKYI